MIGFLFAAVLSGTSATSTANLPGIDTLSGSSSVVVGPVATVEFAGVDSAGPFLR